MESPFSALLEAKIGAGLAVLAGVAAPVAAKAGSAPESTAPASGKETGKPGGKILPDLPQIAAEALPDIAAAQSLPSAVAAPAELEAKAESEPVTPVDAAAVAVLPAAVPTPAAPPIVPYAAASTRHAPQRPGMAHPLALPAKAPSPVAAPLPQLAASQPDAAPLAVRPPGQVLHAQFTVAPGHQSLAVPAMTNTPALAIEPETEAMPAVNTAPIQPPRLAAALLVPFKLPVGMAPKNAPTAPAEPAEPAATTAPLVQIQLPSAPIALAPLSLRMPQLTRGETRDLAAAANVPIAATPDQSDMPVTAPSVPVQLETPPLLAASQNAAPLSAPVVASVATAPAPHDFAGLIDRLVEARQAAQATLATQVVNAAVTHAEFGQVSLQFQQDADGLRVVMTGSDPDLARAVQVAAPAAQTGGNNDSNPAPRQDSGGQQSASANQTQSQAQHQRGHASQRFAEEPRGSANPPPRQRSQDDSSARGGIFA